MAKRTLNLSGTQGREYDLDQIAEEARDNETKILVVQVHTFDPTNPAESNPNPLNPKIGQIWLSKNKNVSG